MKRPEKKDLDEDTDVEEYWGIQGYNQACDDWEKYLPSYELDKEKPNDTTNRNTK